MIKPGTGGILITILVLMTGVVVIAGFTQFEIVRTFFASFRGSIAVPASPGSEIAGTVTTSSLAQFPVYVYVK